jgi:hypothetical protein
LERLFSSIRQLEFVAYVGPLTVVLFFALLSLCRIVALYRFVHFIDFSLTVFSNYHAPFDVYIALNERLVERSNANMLPANLNVCVGKEWYRCVYF